jgi:four helix bundle protein
MHRYERLDAWQKCHELVLITYRVSVNWPATERFGLTVQARRAAVSAAANIAEGAARSGRREFKHFLQIAFGSLTELAYLFRLANDLGYLPAEAGRAVEHAREEAAKFTWGLAKSLLVR